MNRASLKFTQPYWGIILPVLSWVWLIPVLLRSPVGANLEGYTGVFIPFFTWITSSSLNEYVISGLALSAASYIVSLPVINYNFLSGKSYLVSLVFSVFSSLVVVAFGFTPQIIAMIFLILASTHLLKPNRDTKADRNYFNAGFLLGITLILDYSLIVVIPFFVFGIVYLRGFNLREFLVFIVGIIHVFLLMSVALFLNGQGTNLSQLMKMLPQFSVATSHQNRNILLIILSISLVLTLSGLGVIFRALTNRDKKRLRFYLITTLIITVFQILSQFIFRLTTSWIYMAIPYALLLSIQIVSLRKKLIQLIVSVLVISVFVVMALQYFAI